jgi:glyoxylase-like metal-dependent hydrolase (beta-lactamase superfamily II)
MTTGLPEAEEESPVLRQLSEHLYRFDDTCNVYVVRSGNEAILVDFGTGDVLDALPEIGVERVTDVLVTHHHRDQVQGLPHAAAAGIRIWVPGPEQELFTRPERRRQSRGVLNNYNTREDRFSITESVPIAGPIPEYIPTEFGAVTVTAVPLPGHTVGSVGFLVDVDGRRAAFTGDLIAGPGKVWSLAATQWTYAGPEGLAASVLSLLDLRDRAPDLLLPAHGSVMDDPPTAIDLTVERLRALLDLRGQHRNVVRRRERPFEQITPHLLYNHVSFANSYVLLSDTGKALVVDYGYDLDYGLPAGTDRAARRPWLYTLPTLKAQFGVERIDVVIPTHYHDDHVAAFNLLRDVEGTRVWVPANFVDVLAHPSRYNLPCLWYDPIVADRVLPLGDRIAWEEHELVLHPLPGHTLYAVAIESVVDGTKVLFTGDQHDGEMRLNYVYQNRFRIPDYRASGELYRRLAPDVLLTGHWGPVATADGLLDDYHSRGVQLERLHRDLLPLDEADFDAEGFGAWIRPYESELVAGQQTCLEVEVRNPAPTREEVQVTLNGPAGWTLQPANASVTLDPGEHRSLKFDVTAPEAIEVYRAVVTADLRVGDRRYGQHAEALLSVR